MIGYVMVGTNNLEAAIKFYDEVLEIIYLVIQILIWFHLQDLQERES